MTVTIPATLVNLGLRGEPQQKRAKATFERILSATAELVQEVGIDRITTIEVARRAEANISTLYRYFPNKYALVKYLAQRLGERQNTAVNEYLAAADPHCPWEEVLDGVVDQLVAVSRREAAFVSLQRALMAVPELREEYRRSSDDVSEFLMERMRRWGIELPNARIHLVIKCMGECSATLLDLAVSDGRPYDDDVVEELKQVFKGYVRTYMPS